MHKKKCLCNWICWGQIWVYECHINWLLLFGLIFIFLYVRDWSALRKNRASLRHVKPKKFILQKGKLTLKTNTRCVVFFSYPQNHIWGLFTEVKGLSAVENFVRCNPSHWKKFSSNRAVGTRKTRGQSPPPQPRFLQKPSPSKTLWVLLVLPYFHIVLRSC